MTIKVGDLVDVKAGGKPLYRGRVTALLDEMLGLDARLDNVFNLPVTGPGSEYYTWNVVDTRETLPTTVAARPVVYGATCKRCNALNEYAEYAPNFVCWGCRS